MAQNQKRNSGFKDNYSMINVDFNDKEKRDINTWIEGRTVVLSDELLDAVDGNFKVSFSRDDYHDLYLASFTSKQKINGRKKRPIYLLRHADFTKLLAIAIYFFKVMLDSGMNDYTPELSEYDW